MNFIVIVYTTSLPLTHNIHGEGTKRKMVQNPVLYVLRENSTVKLRNCYAQVRALNEHDLSNIYAFHVSETD